ncbi:hypothetical protein ABEB36_003520 [Hypothenemus hampei]|uniref:Uncharacterized protein n=1 Tax=Hypothenemus hampei TaxID=57062 RepID=A0ABD1F9G3_HYPHA
MVYVKQLFFLAYISSICCDRQYNKEPDLLWRKSRTCQHKPYVALEPFYRKSILESTSSLIFIVLLGILFGFLFLGFMKGLVGLCCSKKLAEYGLSTLIDLPKPLNSYRESELKDRPVYYDVIGWPVHPDTGERTVRILSTKTEFCLNLIFFLAYPLAFTLKLCSVCCCIRDYQGEDDECFREINVIRYRSNDKSSTGPQIDKYKNNDHRETKDTNYVVNCMKYSQMSLEKLH